MLIDDDEPTNFISTMIIEEADCSHHLEVVESGSKALEYLKNAIEAPSKPGKCDLPDIIFLDINMPRMNGWEFLEEYLKLPMRQPSKPVIVMLTTSLNPDDKIRAGAIAEVADFRIKPLTAEMIEQVMETYFTVEAGTLSHAPANIPCRTLQNRYQQQYK